MCVTSGEAKLSATIIYSGEAKNDWGDLVHVLGYQNKAITAGQNMMILPLPASGTVKKEDVRVAPVDFLSKMVEKVKPKARSLGYSLNKAPEVFKVGSYQVCLAKEAGEILPALEAMGVDPTMSFDVPGFYGKTYPGHTLALCVWGGKIEAEPIFFQYHPMNPKVLFAPTLDGHGKEPRKGNVVVDHTILWGTTVEAITTRWYKEATPRGLPSNLKGWVGNYTGAFLPDSLPNGDSILPVERLKRSNGGSFSIPAFQRVWPGQGLISEVGFW